MRSSTFVLLSSILYPTNFCPSLYYPNPILHQVCFGLILHLSIYRMIILFKTAPSTIPAADLRAAKHYILTGSLFFALAFGMWNVDNVWCNTWTAVRAKSWSGDSWSGVGALVGAVTQGHAWWHLLTGLGCARIGVGSSCERIYPSPSTDVE